VLSGAIGAFEAFFARFLGVMGGFLRELEVKARRAS